MTLQATVIIPTYEDWDVLQACLDCLAGQTAAPELFEVIVANNNPSAEVPASLRLPRNARVIHATIPGSYAARNAALKEARGDVLFFTDSDCLPDPRWVEAGLARIATLGPVGRIGGAVELLPKDGTWTALELFDKVNSLRQQDYVRRGWCLTANLVTRRAAFDLAGPFDEDRYSGGDGEWNMRAQERGSTIVYCPDTLVRHPARGSFAELAKKRRRLMGGVHQKVLAGRMEKRPMLHFLMLVTPGELRRTMTSPDLTDRERMSVLWIGMRLGLVSIGEVIRLRYLSTKPRRS